MVDDVIEMKLTQEVGVATTALIRDRLRERREGDGLRFNPVELMRFHVIVHCTRGSGTHMVDFEEHSMEPGTAIWIRPGQVQRWDDTSGFDADVLVFGSATIPDLPLFDRFIGTTTVAHLGEDANHLQQQMEWIRRDLEQRRDFAVAAAVVGVILRLLVRGVVGDDASVETPAGRLAKAFVDSIDQNVDQRTVAWHASQVGASTRSVARATNEALNQSPKDVIDARVILEAQRRLAWSDSDIATISRGLRFTEASNFTKYFRSRTGVSPSEFRDSIDSLDNAPLGAASES